MCCVVISVYWLAVQFKSGLHIAYIMYLPAFSNMDLALLIIYYMQLVLDMQMSWYVSWNCSTRDTVAIAILYAPVSIALMLYSTGELYQPGDYKTAADLTRRLIHDGLRRTQMGHAARLEVEKKGWLPAIHRINDQQYQRAIRTFKAHKR